MGGGCCVGDCCIGDCGFCCIGDCGFCCIFDLGGGGSCCVGDSAAPPNSVDNSKKVAGELAEKQQLAAKMATEEENKVLEHIDKGITNFLATVEKFNNTEYGGRKLYINIEGIHEKNQKLREEVSGFIGRRMADRLVMTDKELSVILKEPNESTRRKNFEDFYKRIMKKALSDLEERIQQTAKEQQTIVETAIRQRLAEIDDSMEKIQREYNDLLKAIKADSAKILERQINYEYRLDVCGISLDKVDEAKRKGR